MTPAVVKLLPSYFLSLLVDPFSVATHCDPLPLCDPHSPPRFVVVPSNGELQVSLGLQYPEAQPD